jgi:Flp pilus assembly pilin Flp
MLRNFWMDENGFVISAELVLVLTIAVLAMVVGLSEVAVAVTTELNDVSNAIGALRQSYGFTGLTGDDIKVKSFWTGSTFIDGVDDCDLNTTCQIVVGRPGAATAEGAMTP